MADLLSHPITVSLFSLLVGTLFGAILTRLQSKTAILTWSSSVDRIALSAEDQIFGSVRVVWAGQAVRNLYLVKIVVENASNRDFENVELNVYSANDTFLLNERTEVEASPYIVEWTDKFKKDLQVVPGGTATPLQVQTYSHAREYIVPVFNRGQRLHLAYLCTRPGDDIQPGVYVSTRLRGARLIHHIESLRIYGAPIKHAIVRGSVIAFLVFLACGLFLKNVWVASCIILTTALFSQMLGAYQFRIERWFWRLIAG